MKLSVVPLVALALVPHASAHYFFGRLVLDGKWTNTWEYVRKISGANPSNPVASMIYPNSDPDSNDIRCGRNASVLQSPIKTAKINAGDKVGFAVGEITEPPGQGNHIYHQGLANAWLSRAPDDNLDAYTGDGDWFKIFEFVWPSDQSIDYTQPGAIYDQFRSLWGPWNLQAVNFTIPATTPPGKYLLRFEHIFPVEFEAQWFVNCAHVEIVNTGAVGVPAPMAKIPGVYKRLQPELYFYTYDWIMDHNYSLAEYVPPGPKAWEG